MDAIMTYLLQKKNMMEAVAVRTADKVSKYDDIRDEFEAWITTGAYQTENALVVGGYSAQEIYQLAPFMDGVGVFNFMVTLREEPAKAKEYIAAGFKRK